MGNTFYPKTQLGIDQSQMMSSAASMAPQLGDSTSLRFVSAVDELGGGSVIKWSNRTQVTAIRTCVENPSQYGQVYGRLDLQEFNTTSPATIYKELSLHINQLSLSGAWLDHASSTM